MDMRECADKDMWNKIFLAVVAGTSSTEGVAHSSTHVAHFSRIFLYVDKLYKEWAERQVKDVMEK